MTLKLYGLKNCDTCRKALKAIKASGQDITFVDIRGDDVSAQNIKVWLEAFGADRLLNKKSTTWRGLDEAEKTNVTADKAAQLLNTHRALIKRPVIEGPDGLSVSWSQEVQDQRLG